MLRLSWRPSASPQGMDVKLVPLLGAARDVDVVGTVGARNRLRGSAHGGCSLRAPLRTPVRERSWHVLFDRCEVHRVPDQRGVSLGEPVEALLQLTVRRREMLVRSWASRSLAVSSICFWYIAESM